MRKLKFVFNVLIKNDDQHIQIRKACTSNQFDYLFHLVSVMLLLSFQSLSAFDVVDKQRSIQQ